MYGTFLSSRACDSLRREEGSTPRAQIGKPKAWGNSWRGSVRQGRFGRPAGLLPAPIAGGAVFVAIVAGLVSAPAVLMVTFTASSIGSLKGTSMRSSPCS